MTSQTELVEQLTALIIQSEPFHAGFIENSLGILREKERLGFNKYLAFCLGRGLSLEYLAKCYLTIVEDTFREQMFFMRHKRYRYSSFAEVAEKVYFNPDYMDKYMYGLAITAFLWPNHIYLAREFEETLPKEAAGRYLEIGPGHGYNIMTAMEVSSYTEFTGVDISSASIEQTRAITSYFRGETTGRLQLKQVDFLDSGGLEKDGFDAIVMGEVLEHVEAPTAFLARIRELANRDAHIFITTCVNAPAVDHIYLWRTTRELEDMIEESGFRIKKALRLPYADKTLKQSEEEGLAVNVSYVLEVNK